jgi:hypothetical protein
MVTQKVHAAVTAAWPYVSSFVLTTFTIIGFFLLQEFGRFNELQCTVHDIEKRFVVVEEKQLTTAEGLEIWKEIQLIRVKIAEVQALIPSRSPPEWFEKRVDDLIANMNVNSTQLREVLVQLNKNTELIDEINAKLEE